MLFIQGKLAALTAEQAQAYEPAQLPAAMSAVVEPPLIASGERVKTAWGARREGWVRAVLRKDRRSWKEHRRHQRGSSRI